LLKILNLWQPFFSWLRPELFTVMTPFDTALNGGGNYMEADLAVEKNGSEIWDAETDFNHSKIYALVEKLHEHAVARGEPWKAFVLSYREGEQVKTKFDY